MNTASHLSTYDDIPDVALLGYAGSGKGTGAKILKQEFNLNSYVESGGILREVIKANPVVAQEFQAYVDRGELVPDEILFKHIRPSMLKLPRPWLLDGVPRRESQLDFMRTDTHLRLKNLIGIHIDTTEDVAEERMQQRVEWSLANGIPVRKDDLTAAVRKKRRDEFNENGPAILSKLEQEGKLIKIDGNQNSEVVAAELIEKFTLQLSAIMLNGSKWHPRNGKVASGLEIKA